MDTQTLRTFLLLSKLKSFTQTAERLFIAQSTVTNRIAELEKEVGKALFIRTRRNIELTAEGILFTPYAERIIDLEEASISDINASSKYSSFLRIGTTNSIYDCHMFSLIHSFTENNPYTSVKVTIGHSSELLQMLQDNILDVVFSFLPVHKSGYNCTNFHVDKLVLVTNCKNTEFIHGIRRKELKDINYLMCNFALKEVGQFIRELFPPYHQFSFEIDNSAKLIPYLLDRTGYSFLPQIMVAPYVKEKKLIVIPLLDFETPEISNYYITKTDTDFNLIEA
ncbi:MAG: LysR family transcriptional regulator [Lachnospiraceae bacterium]|nr:LysR family transcriptional regulator [Lachnospiraceae bacterium]